MNEFKISTHIKSIEEYIDTERKALINGQLVEYNGCDENKESELYPSWEYLGQGTIYSLDGVRQVGSTKLYHFWVKPDYQDSELSPIFEK